MTKIVPVILSGGSGTRLWPLSRSSYPKQLLDLTSERTMLQETVARVTESEIFTPPVVISNDAHRFTIASQMADFGVAMAAHILEPVGRNTAPAAVVAALAAEQLFPGCQILILPADHFIEKPGAFVEAVKLGATAAAQGGLITFGIVPTHADTGFGYIRVGPGEGGVHEVAEFVEKPNLETAEEYVASGDYYWNAGIFLFSAETLLEEANRHCPEILAACRASYASARQDLDFLRLDSESFEQCPSDSIDFAIMEKTDRAKSVPVSMGWNDVGSWRALWELGAQDANANVTLGDVIAIDSADSYIRAQDSLVATLGIKGLVVIQTPDAILVADKAKVSEIKSIVAHLEENGRGEHAFHQKVHRPWGYYESLDVGLKHQVKHIYVKPGASLSLQLHNRRAEHWVVVEGKALVTVGDETREMQENESVYIPIGSRHRLENSTGSPLHLIEVQTGDYLGEDDIVRFEDIYGRKEE
ncbi:MAG: mannose-1-phosphate guanylyltransferase/mannose-6-phosphate isomerase [Alphaproteobacteria bacterium]|nr:MAG: mannose-1-phosphate guanylyltransferase/mannose-6-phosphate isomerase [Alphaproteobacteria bacterium]